MNTDRCKARGILVGSPSGPRVAWYRFLDSLTPVERARWHRESNNYPTDEHGMLPEPVERFLETLEAEMATTAPKKRATSGRTKRVGMQPKAKRAARKKAEANGDASPTLAAGGDKTKNDPNQPSLPGIDE
jgi:hypothetical protein